MYSKELNCYLYKLNKADHKRLNKHGWVNDGIGDGFVNTTKQSDSQIPIGLSPTLIIDDKGYEFVVQYYSGCFYPIWRRVRRLGDKVINFRFAYKLKNNIVERIKL